jgi:lysophospholipase L1-like esterase
MRTTWAWHYIYVDVYSVLLDKEAGRANMSHFKDGLHPNDAVYGAIATFLTPYIKRS